jgi:hypothetical protein
MQSGIWLNDKGKRQLRFLEERVRSWHGIQGRSDIFRRAIRCRRWVNAGTWRENDRRWRVIKLRDIEWLSEKVCRIELVEGNGARSLGGHGGLRRLRRHEMGVGHAHRAELLGHLCDSWSSRGSIPRRCCIHLTWVRPIYRLLISRGLRLRGICTVTATSGELSPKSSIGTRSNFKGFPSICTLLLTTCMTLGGSSGGHAGVLLSGRPITGRLTVPFLGRIAPLW